MFRISKRALVELITVMLRNKAARTVKRDTYRMFIEETVFIFGAISYI